MVVTINLPENAFSPEFNQLIGRQRGLVIGLKSQFLVEIGIDVFQATADAAVIVQQVGIVVVGQFVTAVLGSDAPLCCGLKVCK